MESGEGNDLAEIDLTYSPTRGISRARRVLGRLIVCIVQVEHCEDPDLLAFILLAVIGAFRKGELLPRRWDDLDMESNVPTINIGMTKNGDPRMTPLPPVAVETLRALLSFGMSAYLFPSTPTNKDPNPKQPHRYDFRKEFRELCEKAGLGSRRIHDLRRTTASTLLAAGVSNEITKTLTGHRSRELERYLFLDPAFRASTTERVAAVLIGSGYTKSDTGARKDKKRGLNNGRKGSINKGLDGGLEATQTPDLYRVKVAHPLLCQWSERQVIDLAWP
jgi:hypothetical protein